MRVQLGGYVTDSETAAIYRRWGYTGVCCPDDIRSAVQSCPEGEELIFEINSGGGSVYAGFEMYTLLRNANRETVGEIGSMAGSAASVFAMGCTKLRISPVANMMMHRASTWTSGNSQDIGEAKQMLETIDDSILTAYDQRTGEKCSREELKEMMENETFLTAEAALTLGLVDEIMFQEGGDAIGRAAVAMVHGMPLVLNSLPPIDELKRRETGGENTAGNPANEEERALTLDELMEQNPDLVNQIRTEAANAERERIQAIDEMSMAGFEDLVSAARQDPNATAESVAVAIVRRQQEQGNSFLTGRAKDAEDSGVNDVEGSAGTEGADELKSVLDEVFSEN